MSAIIGQMLLCLLIAALIGAVIGWLLKTIFGGNAVAIREQDWRAKLLGRDQDLVKARGEVNEHLSDLERTRKDLSGEKEKVAALHGNVSQHEQRLGLLSRELQDKASALDTSEKGLAAARAQLTTTVAERDALSSRMHLLETDHKTLLPKFNTLTANHQVATTRFATLESTHQALSEKWSALDQERGILRQQFADAESARNAKTQDVARLSTELDALKQQLVTAKAESADFNIKLKLADALRVQLDDANHKLQEREQQLRSARDEQQKTKSELDAAHQQAANLKTTVATHESSLGAHASKMSLLQGEADSKTNAHAQLTTAIDALRQTLQSRDDKIQSLEDTLAANTSTHQAAQRGLDTETAKLRLQLSDAHTAAQHRDNNFRSLEADLAARASAHNALEADASALRAQLALLAVRDAEIRDADARQQAALRIKESEIVALRTRTEELVTLRSQYNEANVRVRDGSARHAQEVQARDVEIAQRIARIRELEAQLAAKPAPILAREPVTAATVVSTAMPSKRGERDDLKKIFGIGPVLEQLLNKLGVFHYRDIATWKPADIKRVDALLENFHGRIERDHWIAGAKEEHFKKYQERI